MAFSQVFSELALPGWLTPFTVLSGTLGRPVPMGLPHQQNTSEVPLSCSPHGQTLPKSVMLLPTDYFNSTPVQYLKAPWNLLNWSMLYLDHRPGQ